MKKILAIIPARKGSKGIKNKNIININGKPLIYYTIKSAKESRYITDIVGSTDCKKIAAIFRKNNVKVPVIRPKKLSGDHSNIVDTLIFTLIKNEQIYKTKYDYVCLLQPTSPLREKNEIDRAIKKIIKTKSDTIISLCKLDEPHPYKLFEIKNKKIVFSFKRKKKILTTDSNYLLFICLQEIYILLKEIYLSKKKVFLEKKILIHLLNP